MKGMIKIVTIVEEYLENILLPRIISFGATTESASIVKNDIHTRLLSIISQWNDEEFRNTILFTGLEEACFYDSEASLDIKCLVVVAIRNSLLEDMKSTIRAAKKLGLSKPIIDDNTIKIITHEAIQYFNKHDFKCLSFQRPNNNEDSNPYVNLKDKYPVAWEAMKQLSQCINYIQFPSLEIPSQKPSILINPANISGTKTEVQSGIDPTIDSLLQQILNLVIEGKQPFFFCDCFKMISRNPDKLFKILNLVLSSNAPVVTINYYISNGYVARRTNLLRPAHNESDIVLKLRNLSGVRKTHANILKIMRDTYN
ncbi:hypothetical protein [Paenibacillus motobuensis]|uniref:Uncharacterized protein n=1 Tax=Paenibacillus motobuensis TaxID=295324 RepID=A0ABN0Y9C8_9BACL